MNRDFDDLPSTQRFSSRVEHYAKYRPGYPAELLSLLEREAGLTPASVVADIGSGTGILSELLLKNGNEVIAIEPNPEMRQAADRLYARWSAFHNFPGTAEATGIPNAWVHGITVAQAFHWFDGPRAAAEFRRIVKPGGFVALIWNARDTAASPFMTEYERIVLAHGSTFARSGKELVPFERLRDLFGPGLRLHVLRNFQELDWEGLKGRLLSASYMPLEGQAGHEPMVAELRRAFDAHTVGGRVRMEYECRVYLTRL
ncbi:MAG TPA: class I SAM-dependent methyltransferase [Tepidisphaeraceae bacterium]|jgi:SAM-dependent methyltransferase